MKNSLVNQFKLFIDDADIIRCGGRLHNARLSYNMKHPVLLPPNHHFTELVATQAHVFVLHGGVEITLIHQTNLLGTTSSQNGENIATTLC